MLFKRFSAPGGDPAAAQFTVCIKHGNAWTTQEWTSAQWHAWLAELSPRELVRHMSKWQRYADTMPAMREAFSFAVEDARRILCTQECSQVVERG